MKRRILYRFLTAAGIVVLAAELGIRHVPLPADLETTPPSSVVYLDRNGFPLRRSLVENRHAIPLTLDAVPERLIDAVVAAEDRRFFSHTGVDWWAVVRAAWNNVRAGHITSGASTITQQLVKLADPRPRTLGTKLLEAVRAMRLEREWTKEEILLAYLNRLDFGNLNVGCEAAANDYFGKPTADLSLAECAFLAGLPQSPTRLNPRRNLAASIARQQTVLRRMRDAGLVKEAEYHRARMEPLRLLERGRDFLTPHFVDLVQAIEPDRSGEIHTTVDLALSRFVEGEIADQLAKLKARNVGQAAAVILDNHTGDVLALVGSGDYFAPGEGQVNGALAVRSPGSALKPFTYLLAMEHGDSPESVVLDTPVEYPTPTGIYRPENYDRAYHGAVSFREALACSLNVAAVRVLDSVGGADPLRDRLQRCGLTTLTAEPGTYGLGLTIGNAGVKLLELTNAYACLARMGVFLPWRVISDQPEGMPRPVCDPRAARMIADILSDNDARARAFGIDSPLRFDFPVACKTGTSSDFRDNWAIGYTPEFTVGVWCGNFDGSPMREVSSASGAAPILHAIFEHLHARFGTTWYSEPVEIVRNNPETIPGAGDFERGLRIVSPRPGSQFLIDPDLPEESRWIPLLAAGGDSVEWTSDSLPVRSASAWIREGRHALVAFDPSTGKRQTTWITVTTE